jgi:DNA-directed RNA polymerase specialized sigma24 family protein
MADQQTPVAPRGDEAELFRSFNQTLMRDVDSAVFTTSPTVVEDACSHAWAQFMRYQPDRSRNWQGWLFRAAQREAWRLEREVHQDRPLRTSEDERKTVFGEAIDPRDYQAITIGVDDALSVVQELPPRLQQIAMLRALGLRYSEIGEITGDSPTRVGALVTRANMQISEIILERNHHERSESPRAERLWQLEHEQPQWLVDQIGRLPSLARRTEGHSVRRRAWRRAALALDDLRELVGTERLADVVATRPTDPGLRRPHELARRAIDELHEPTREHRFGD